MALVSCAVLLYEILVTRIMSVMLWYHFAFLSISLALLALGAPGVWFSVRGINPGSLRKALLSSVLLIPISVFLLIQAHYYFDRPIVLFIVTLLMPLLSLGAAVCILLMKAPGKEIGRVYAADLIGATVGAALVVPLMYLIPTPLLLVVTGLLPLLALAILEKAFRTRALLLGLGILVVASWGTPFELRKSSKAHNNEPPAWGTGYNYTRPSEPTERLYLEYDGSARTFITKLDRPIDDLDNLFFDVTAIGYQVGTPERVCIIGAGGGEDILTARKAGARDITAVEINGKTIDTLSGPFKEYTGDVYHLEDVKAVAGEGRSYLSRSAGEYDLIQISLIDTWAATTAGAMTLSENYLYTVEAFRLYFRKLSNKGLISTSRWNHDDPGFRAESVRLVFMAMKALELEGIEDARKHFAFIQGGEVGTLLISKAPFTPSQIDELDQASAHYGFARLWPLTFWPTDYSKHISWVPLALLEGPAWFHEQGFNVAPPTDNKPFFFDTISQRLHGSLRLALICVSVLALALFFLPFLLNRTFVKHPGFWRGSLYFAAIGIGFMLVELPWIQSFILYLGHPSYSTTVILASLLLGAGLGSFVAVRIPTSSLRYKALLLPLVLIIVSLLSPSLFQTTLGWSFGLRLLFTFLLVVPVGFLMGFPFPIGMILFGEGNKAWFWAVNGMTSVLGSVSSVVLAMTFGLAEVLILGTTFYLLAILVFRSVVSE
jgi:spermidine synthase